MIFRVFLFFAYLIPNNLLYTCKHVSEAKPRPTKLTLIKVAQNLTLSGNQSSKIQSPKTMGGEYPKGYQNIKVNV